MEERTITELLNKIAKGDGESLGKLRQEVTSLQLKALKSSGAKRYNLFSRADRINTQIQHATSFIKTLDKKE